MQSFSSISFRSLLILLLFRNPVLTAQQQSISLAKKAFEYTNAFRIKKKLPTLSWNQNLADSATAHSKNMAEHTIPFCHAGFKERIASLTIHPKASAENIFMCNMQGDISRIALDSWIQSQGHLKNLVGNYTACGIGVYKNDEGYWYFTQIFGLY